MDASVTARRPRRGFTLIEMLAVVVIIGILASLITVAALNALTRAKEAKIKLEIDQLAMALSEYKNQYGDYPPDSLTNTDAVKRHLARAFPRADIDDLMDSLPNITPASALVFWLGGKPDANGVPDGFNADPRNPFAPGGSRTKPLFEFKQERLAMDENGSPAYYPETGTPAGPEACPYCYFKAVNGTYQSSYPAGGDKGTAVPYLDTRTNLPVAKDKFQIVSAGLDNDFGSGNQFPAGGDYTPGSFDNITSFADGTLEDEMP